MESGSRSFDERSGAHGPVAVYADQHESVAGGLRRHLCLFEATQRVGSQVMVRGIVAAVAVFVLTVLVPRREVTVSVSLTAIELGPATRSLSGVPDSTPRQDGFIPLGRATVAHFKVLVWPESLVPAPTTWSVTAGRCEPPSGWDRGAEAARWGTCPKRPHTPGRKEEWKRP